MTTLKQFLIVVFLIHNCIVPTVYFRSLKDLAAAAVLLAPGGKEGKREEKVTQENKPDIDKNLNFLKKKLKILKFC